MKDLIQEEGGPVRMHQVEVDNEVFAFVKAHAEPLEDTFNSALRRLLPLEDRKRQDSEAPNLKPSPKTGSAIPSYPTGTPQALQQILSVARLVCGGAYSRTGATQFVAKQLDVAPQTVLDKYCRQLQLTASEFDRLLEQDSLMDLGRILRSKFSHHSDVIDDVIASCGGSV